MNFISNGHNAIRLELDKRGIRHTKKENSFTMMDNPELLQKIANSINGYTVQHRIDYWMNRCFNFDKGHLLNQIKTPTTCLVHDTGGGLFKYCLQISSFFVPVSWNGSWTNSPASDCPTASLRSLINGLIVPDPKVSGDSI